MAATHVFVPNKPLSDNPRDWQAQLGLLPWTTHIVFTKESLIKFLKTVEVEVDTNMTQIKKLPQYAQFGTLRSQQVDSSTPDVSATTSTITSTSSASSQVTQAQQQQQQQQQVHHPLSSQGVGHQSPLQHSSTSNSGYIPTRRVREQPGGGSAQIASLFAGNDDDDIFKDWQRKPTKTTPAGLSVANPSTTGMERSVTAPASTTTVYHDTPVPPPRTTVLMPDGSEFVPSRRVREPVGGHSNMASILFGDGE